MGVINAVRDGLKSILLESHLRKFWQLYVRLIYSRPSLASGTLGVMVTASKAPANTAVDSRCLVPTSTSVESSNTSILLFQ